MSATDMPGVEGTPKPAAHGAQPVDVFVIGGGINGAGIARDAAGRGYSVRLAEMNDLASGTSSWSTKLIHGGLRYLEHYEFRLVREALMEREVLWGMAPHIIWPLRFVLPHHKGIRPAWLIRLGLFLYDHIGGRKALPATRVLDLAADPAGKPLKPQFRKAFEYSDCWVDDARLVVLNAMDARARGAVIETRTRVVGARRDGPLWSVTLEHADGGRRETVEARLIVNAAGPWVDGVLLTRDAVGDVPAALVASTLVLYLLIYAVLTAAYVSVLFYLAGKAAKGEVGEVDAARRPVLPHAVPAE